MPEFDILSQKVLDPHSFVCAKLEGIDFDALLFLSFAILLGLELDFWWPRRGMRGLGVDFWWPGMGRQYISVVDERHWAGIGLGALEGEW